MKSTKLTQLPIEAAFLIGLRTSFMPATATQNGTARAYHRSTGLYQCWSDKLSIYINAPTVLTVSFPSRDFRALKQLWRVEREVSDFWQDRLVAAYQMETLNTGSSYFTQQCLAEITSDTAHYIFASDGINALEVEKEIEKLFDVIFGSVDSSSLVTHTDFIRHSHVLYVFPTHDLIDIAYDAETARSTVTLKNENELINAFKYFRQMLSEEARGIVPQVLFDTMLLPSVIHPTYPDIGLTLLGLTRVTRSHQSILTASSVAFDVLEYLRFKMILPHLLRRLTGLPFARQGIADYLIALKRDGGFGSAYGERFLVDREVEISERAIVELTAREIDKHLQRGWILQAMPHLTITLPPDRTTSIGKLLGGEIREIMARRITTDADRIARTIKLIRERGDALSDHLRDGVTIEATQSNLKLSRNVQKLTRASIVIAIAALIVSIFLAIAPDGDKRTLYNWATSLFNFTRGNTSGSMPLDGD